MKLLSLKLSAFGPFKKEQQLDFSCLEGADIFLISGDTGAGKTTIFDAVCFALYGETSGGRKNTRTLKSDFAPPSQQLSLIHISSARSSTWPLPRVDSSYHSLT